MKKITKYQANDGTLFNTEKECEEYEKYRSIISKIEDDLWDEIRNGQTEKIYEWIVKNTNGFK